MGAPPRRAGEPENSRLPGRRRRLHQHQRRRHRREQQGAREALPDDRRPAHRGRAPGAAGGRGRGRRPGRDPGRLHHRLRPLPDRRLHRRRRGQERDHRPGHGRRRTSIPTVDTIFEIGGQDSKYISLEQRRGRRFRDEQGLRRRHRLVPRRAGREAGHQHQGRVRQPGPRLGRPPSRLGERCTVFMESDLVRHQQQGAKTRRPGRRPVLLHRHQLPQPRRRGQAGRRAHLLPGRHRLQPGRRGGLREGHRQADHRARRTTR